MDLVAGTNVALVLLLLNVEDQLWFSGQAHSRNSFGLRADPAVLLDRTAPNRSIRQHTDNVNASSSK